MEKLAGVWLPAECNRKIKESICLPKDGKLLKYNNEKKKKKQKRKKREKKKNNLEQKKKISKP